MARRPRQVIEYRFYELPLHFPVVLLDGKIWRISDMKSDRLHFHNCLEIGICHSDGGTIMLWDEPSTFREGDVTMIPRHVPHTTYSAKGVQSLWSYIFVDLKELLSGLIPMPDVLHKPGLSFEYLMSQTTHPKVHFLVHTILDELRDQKEGYQNAVRGLFIALYYEVLRLQTEKSEPGPGAMKKDTLAITPALEYIGVHYMNKVVIQELSDMCHLSETHFRRLFLTIMGTSPLAFINAARIDRACILLKTTETPILEIADEVGFTSLSSFNRTFTAIMKVSPRSYRNTDATETPKPHHKYVLQYTGWVAPEK